MYHFNPRSHEGSDKSLLLLTLLIFYFNPRSHEGSDFFIFHFPPLLKISIHAPTRGATEKGIDRIKASSAISIHAPTRGATHSLSKGLHQVQNFNPRSHEGSDNCCSMVCFHIILFQSTLPRGERQQPLLYLLSI